MTEIEYISSRRNGTISKIRSLSDAKFRKRERLFRFDGVKLCSEAIDAGVNIQYILSVADRFEKIRKRVLDSTGKDLLNSNARILTVDADVFASVSDEKSPDGIICVAGYLDKLHKINTMYDERLREKKVILLENVADPGNLGAVLRSALAFGIDAVLLCGDCADVYNPKTVRGAMGAVFRTETFSFSDAGKAAEFLFSAGKRLLSAVKSESAVSLDDITLSSSDCIAIGNEGHGLGPELVSLSSLCVSIPVGEHCESLNAAVAASVFMWEMRRQTFCKGKHE